MQRTARLEKHDLSLKEWLVLLVFYWKRRDWLVLSEAVLEMLESPRQGFRDLGIKRPQTIAEHTKSLVEIVKAVGDLKGWSKSKIYLASLIALVHDWEEITKGDVPVIAKDEMPLRIADRIDWQINNWKPPTFSEEREKTRRDKSKGVIHVNVFLGWARIREPLRLAIEWCVKAYHDDSGIGFIVWQIDKLEPGLRAVEYEKQLDWFAQKRGAGPFIMRSYILVIDPDIRKLLPPLTPTLEGFESGLDAKAVASI